MHKTGTEPNRLSYQESLVRGPGLSRVCAPVPITGDSPGDQEEGVVQGKKPASGSPRPRTERAGGVAVKRTPGWNLWEGGACAEGRGSAGPARQVRPEECGGNSGERRARRTGFPGGGSRAAARPGGWSPSRRPREAGRSGGERRAGVAGALGQQELPNLRGRSARPSRFREVTAREVEVSTPTQPTHLGSPLAAARQAALALHHPVRPPAAALPRRLLLFVPHCTTLPPPPRK